jgi:hypothetical protein
MLTGNELVGAVETEARAAIYLKNEIMLNLSRSWPTGTFDDIRNLPPGELFQQLLLKRYISAQSLEAMAAVVAKNVINCVNGYDLANLKSLWHKTITFPETIAHVPQNIPVSEERVFKVYILTRECRSMNEYVLVFNRNGVGWGILHAPGEHYLFSWKEIPLGQLPEFVIEGWMTQTAYDNEFSRTIFPGCGLEILQMFEQQDNPL